MVTQHDLTTSTKAAKGYCMNHYTYTNTDTSRIGLMVCCQCHKKITTGQFRYHESKSGDAYITCHRYCCESDPKWTELDLQKQATEKRQREFESDCKAFADKWGAEFYELLTDDDS